MKGRPASATLTVSIHIERVYRRLINGGHFVSASAKGTGVKEAKSPKKDRACGDRDV